LWENFWRLTNLKQKRERKNTFVYLLLNYLMIARHMEKKLIAWHSKPIIYYANSTSITKKIWWFNKSLMLFSCQLCYFNTENWLSVYYDCRFARNQWSFQLCFFPWLTNFEHPHVPIQQVLRFYQFNPTCFILRRLAFTFANYPAELWHW